MLIKYASANIIEVKSASSKIRQASLDKFSDYSDYRTDDGYLYLRTRAISSRTNKNNDSWPSTELEKAYKTFLGKPFFVDHMNHDPQKARGVIVDAKLHIEDEKTSSLDPYYSSDDCYPCHKPPTWIELLVEIDAKSFPKLAKAIASGDIDSVSMGANVEESECSHCGNMARTSSEFCQHIVSKGAIFDMVDHHGRKVSRKAVEHCYKISFFELSAVFDPADETALVSEVKTASVREAEYKYIHERDGKWVITQKGTGKVLSTHDSEEKAQAAFRAMEMNMHGGSSKTADRGNEPPQSDLITAPEEVDTLRQERVCAICGSTLEDGSCEVCGYVEPPEGFDNPDLTKAEEIDDLREDNPGQAVEVQPDQGQGGAQPQPQTAPQDTTTLQQPNNVMSGMNNSSTRTANSNNSKDLKGGRINGQERPILPVARQNSDQPKNVRVTEDHGRPVESKVGTQMDTHKLADGASAEGGADTQPTTRVDATGTGGVMTVGEAQHEDVEKKQQEHAPHTDTWSGNEGDSLGQQDPVTSEAFPNDSQGPTSEKHPVSPYQSSIHEADFPDHDPAHTELEAPLKEEVGGPTSTFPSDDFHITDPVTKQNGDEVGGPIGTPLSSVRSHIFKSMKLAEVEVELGLTDHDNKFERASELEEESPEVLDARLDTLARVKTAGLGRVSKKTSATRMPSLSKRVASTPSRDDSDIDDSAIFMR